MKQAVPKRSKREGASARSAGAGGTSAGARPRAADAAQIPTSIVRSGARSARAAARREAILDAALDEFSAQGFAAARLDDIAMRAGVAKGTIYLYFADKEMLFQELIRSRMGPVVGDLEAVFAIDLPLRLIVEKAVDVFVSEVFDTHRKQIIRLVISEGPRFPAIAEFYYREVLSRAMGSVRAFLQRAHERGELADDTIVRYPQLIAAPAILAIIWNGLFEKFEPLDIRAMMRAHFKALFTAGRPA